MNKGQRQRQRMTEEEKKKKFGDKYDPNFKVQSKPTKSGNQKKEQGIPQHNDISFYALSDQIARDTGSLPYNVLSGTEQKFTYSSFNPGNPETRVATWRNQCVGCIKYIPAQFTNGDTSTGLSMAASQLYEYLRHANSGARNYEVADAIMLVLAMKDIYRAYFELRRLFGIAKFFAFENRALPRTVFRALGVNYTDFIGNMANYRAQINILRERINAIAIPKYFKCFERVAYVSSNWFSDSSSIRGQFYIFEGAVRYQWSGTTSEHGTELQAYSMQADAGEWTVQNLIQQLQAAIAIIEGDTDANTIAGDIKKAFSDAEIYQVAEVEENYRLAPLFDEDILAQIENMRTLADGLQPTASGMQLVSAAQQWPEHTLNVTQKNGLPYWVPWFGQYKTQGTILPISYGPTKRVFNSHKDEPTYADNMEWSRLQPVFEQGYEMNGATTPGNTQVLKVVECGLELPLELTLFTSENDNGSRFRGIQSLYPSGTNPQVQYLPALARISQYDWHPFVYIMTMPGSSATDTVFEIMGDLKKYTLVEASVFVAMHDCANSASFYQRNIGK